MADLSVKKLRAAALRDKECAIAMSQAALISFGFFRAYRRRGFQIDGCF